MEECVGKCDIDWLRQAIEDLSKEGDEWARKYVDDGSMDTLLRALVYLSDIREGTLEEMLPRLECLKAILNRACGMEHLICCSAEKSRLFLLLGVLDCPSEVVKSQVFLLLGAACKHENGLDAVLTALESNKRAKGSRHRFSVIVNELKATNRPEYKACILGFVNYLISACADLDSRLLLRAELNGLGLLDILDTLRHTSNGSLQRQIRVFKTWQLHDQEHLSAEMPGGVDIDSHMSLFQALLQKTLNTEHSIPLLRILQNLLTVDQKTPEADLIWSHIGSFVEKAVTLERAVEGKCFEASAVRRLKKALEAQVELGHQAEAPPASLDKGQGDAEEKGEGKAGEEKADVVGGGSRVAADSGELQEGTADHAAPPPPPSGPPPPPPPPPSGPPPPPPPPPHPPTPDKEEVAQVKGEKAQEKGEEAQDKAEEKSGDRGEGPETEDKSDAISIYERARKYKPKKTMRFVNWKKVKKADIQEDTIWSNPVNSMVDLLADFDTDELEKYFSRVEVVRSGKGWTKSDKGPVLLSDTGKTQKLGVALKGMMMLKNMKAIVQDIKDADISDYSESQLDSLAMKCPDELEEKFLKKQKKDKLRFPEKDLLDIVSIPEYPVRLRLMQMKFRLQRERIEETILEPLKAIQKALELLSECEESSVALLRMLHLILIVGNFINGNTDAGKAHGFVITSLPSLCDTLTNVGKRSAGVNFLHYLALVCERHKCTDLLELPSKLSYAVGQASMHSFVQLKILAEEYRADLGDKPEGRDEPDVVGNDTKTSQTTQHESEEEEEEEQDNPFARAKSKLKKAETRTPPNKMNLYKELDRLKKKKSTAKLQHQLQDFLPEAEKFLDEVDTLVRQIDEATLGAQKYFCDDSDEHTKEEFLKEVFESLSGFMVQFRQACKVNKEEQPFGRRVAADGGEEDVANAAVLVITGSKLAVPWLALSSLRIATDSAGMDGDDQPDGDDEPDSGPGMTPMNEQALLQDLSSTVDKMYEIINKEKIEM